MPSSLQASSSPACSIPSATNSAPTASVNATSEAASANRWWSTCIEQMRETVELHDVGVDGDDVPHRCEAAAGVIDRDPYALLAQRPQHAAELLVVDHGGVLSQLEHDPTSVIAEHGEYVERRWVNESGRAQIHRQVDVCG